MLTIILVLKFSFRLLILLKFLISLATRPLKNLINRRSIPFPNRFLFLAHNGYQLINCPLPLLGVVRSLENFELGWKRFNNALDQKTLSQIKIKRLELVEITYKYLDVFSYTTDTIILGVLQ